MEQLYAILYSLKKAPYFHFVSLIDRHRVRCPCSLLWTVNMKVTREISGSTIRKSACIREMNSSSCLSSLVCLDRAWGVCRGPGVIVQYCTSSLLVTIQINKDA